MDLYAQNILDRYKKPFYKANNESCLTAHSSQLIAHKEANHSCGDVVEIQMELEEDKIKHYRFTGAGCAISMAAADMLGDLVIGMTEKEALELTKEEIYEMLGIEISVRRSKCALLGLLAIQNGLLTHQGEVLKTWKEYHIA